jgi:hypothetical protein
MRAKKEIPDNFEFGQLRAFLAQNGLTQQQIINIIGLAPNGRTRGEIADQLREWLKVLPKANAT